jgi:hypothetical protein
MHRGTVDSRNFSLESETQIVRDDGSVASETTVVIGTKGGGSERGSSKGQGQEEEADPEDNILPRGKAGSLKESQALKQSDNTTADIQLDILSGLYESQGVNSQIKVK